jgi:ComF family protein
MLKIKFPISLCVLCDTPTDSAFSLCHACILELPYNHYACPHCGRGLSIDSTDESEAIAASICENCQIAPPLYNETVSPFIYTAAIRYLIIGLKFNKQLLYAHLLGTLLADAVQDHYSPHDLPEFLLPVPLHKNRVRRRGFNQSVEISRIVSQRLQIPILSKHLIKTHATAPQAELSAQQRQKNLRHSFQINDKIPNARIAIIDDVITTGSTMNEVTRIVQKTGIKSSIYAWSCARTRQ